MISKHHLQVSLEQGPLVPASRLLSKPAITELLRPVLLLQWLHEVCQKGDNESVKIQNQNAST